MLLDRYAYCNRWRLLHPAVKGLLAGLGLAAALAAASPLVPLLVMAVMAGAALLGARIPPAAYLRLLLVPAGFLLASVAGLAISLGGGEVSLVALPVFDLSLGVSQAGLQQAGLALVRALGAVSCLYLLALTTPMTEIIGLLRRLGMPRLLLELMTLAYAQLFVFLQVARAMAVAQRARLGYAGAASSLHSLAGLIANLFLRSHQRARLLHRGLVARGYEEDLCWLERAQPLPCGQLALAAATGGLLLALALLVPG